jgi:hypothetical protein
MQSLRICDIGLSADASSAFHSMLKVLASRATAVWETSGLDRADVLLAHADSDPATLAAWSSTGKPVVLVVDDRGSWPPSQFVLRHPFRVMQLLSILNDVANVIAAPRQRASIAVPSGWCAAESLRHVMANGGERGLHVATDASGAMIWVGEGEAHATPEVFAQMRAGKLALGTFVATQEWPPENARRFPISDLAWYLGLCGPTDLAPWLTSDSTYRLRRWPDFGRLGSDPALIQLSAVAAASPASAAALAKSSNQPQATVHRFLNAASLAGLLTAATSAEPVPKAATLSRQTALGWMKLVGGLRRHLGLSA